MNSLFLDALHCKNTSRPPVWIMRQAGRYMPEYRAIREKYSFLDMCRTPELAAEITHLPLRRFGFDAAILFSDILVIPDALGLGLKMEEKTGPIFERPLHTSADIDQLPTISISDKLSYVDQAIRILKPSLKVPLIGFCGAPFTVASYMIEGGSSKDLRKTKKWMMSDPLSFHRLLEKISQDSIEYLQMQVRAGVDAIQIFDSWAYFLAHPQFREFSLAYLKKLMASVSVPVIIFCRGSSLFASVLAEIQPSGISIDWNGHLGEIRKSIPKTIALQGNLDPDVLYGSKSFVQKEVNRLLQEMKNQPGYIFNLGHGIHPDTPVESVQTLVETIQQ